MKQSINHPFLFSIDFIDDILILMYKFILDKKLVLIRKIMYNKVWNRRKMRKKENNNKIGKWRL